MKLAGVPDATIIKTFSSERQGFSECGPQKHGEVLVFKAGSEYTREYTKEEASFAGKKEVTYFKSSATQRALRHRA